MITLLLDQTDVPGHGHSSFIQKIPNLHNGILSFDNVWYTQLDKQSKFLIIYV